MRPASSMLWVTMMVASRRSRHSAVQQVKDQVAGAAVEIAGRFVGQQQGRLHDQGPGQGGPLLFAAGQFRDPVVAAMAEFHPGPAVPWPGLPSLSCFSRR